jgi:hypothetical protein
MYWTQ